MARPALTVERSSTSWVVTLDRPDRRNALDLATVEELHSAVDEAGASAVTAMVLRSSSNRAFCAGLDLTGLDQETDATLLWRLVRIELLLAAIRAAPFLTVAVVDGPALGAGADLAAACRVRLGSPLASFRFPGVGFGITLGTRHLGSVVGTGRASRTVLTGSTVDAEHALRYGLLDAVLPSSRLDLAAAEIAADVARLPSSTTRDVLASTTTDQGAALSDLVRSAARPGLRERVTAYRSGIASRKAEAEKSQPNPDPETNWREHGVRVVGGDGLDPNTPQTAGMLRAAAISNAQGATKLWAGTVRIEPGALTGAHHHGELESVIYVLRGRARMRWGDRLDYLAEAGPGEFIFVPPFVPHQEINPDPEAPLECLLVRSGQEPIVVNLDIEAVPYPELVTWLPGVNP